MAPLEFQAVVLAAGRGNRFHDLTEGRPKALLPVGPLPVIFYPLHLLQRHGFTEALVVVLESQKPEISQRLEKISQLTLAIEYVCIPNDSEFGTADTLRFISDKIKADPFVVTCDLVTGASLYPAINKFREQNAALVAVMLNGGQDAEVVLPGPKPKEKPDRDIVMLNPKTSRFLFMASMNDYEGQIELPAHLFRSNGKVEAETKLLDAHIYIMKRWVLDFLAESNFTSIKDKLVPFILKKQMSRPPHVSEADKPVSDFNINPNHEDIFNFIPISFLEDKVDSTTIFCSEKNRHDRHSDRIRCFVSLSARDTFGLRVNNLRSFVAANRKSILSDILQPDNQPLAVSPLAKVESNQVTNCLIGENTHVSPKTSLKNSTLGSNCEVSNKTRISDCIIFSNVHIGEGVVLENCVIADRVRIEGGSTLRNCVIGAGYVVEEGTNESKAALTKTDLFMEI